MKARVSVLFKYWSFIGSGGMGFDQLYLLFRARVRLARKTAMPMNIRNAIDPKVAPKAMPNRVVPED